MSNIVLSVLESLELVKLRDNFPAVLDRAITDWTKFKLGMQKGLFSAEQADRALTWFYQFPKLWETMRGNYVQEGGGMLSAHKADILRRGDQFVSDLKGSPFRTWVGLGIAPVVVAGVLVVGGIAAALWAIGYVKAQSNISAIVEGVTSGKIPPDVLKKALEEENKGGLLDDLQGVAKWAAIGVAVWFLAPMVVKMFKGGRGA